MVFLRTCISLAVFALLVLGIGHPLKAGNEDRAGSAGGTQLLINPWARSAGWAGANGATATGIEATYMNVAGLAFTEKTELLFSRSQYLVGSGINISAAGFSQKVGETGVLGLSVMSMNFGDIQVTTTDLPEGGAGTFSPNNANVALSYAKAFSKTIYGGFTLRAISEQIADASAQGIALDAGIRYHTGKNDRTKIGIALKNVGPPMSYEGDGISFTSQAPSGDHQQTVEHRSADFEIPSLVNISASYDIPISEKHEMTTAATFTSNSFTKDQGSFGLEYAFRERFKFRVGYKYEGGIGDEAERTTVYTGPTGGLSFRLPIGEDDRTVFSLNYSYRDTDPFEGVHSFGLRMDLLPEKE